MHNIQIKRYYLQLSIINKLNINLNQFRHGSKQVVNVHAAWAAADDDGLAADDAGAADDVGVANDVPIIADDAARNDALAVDDAAGYDAITADDDARAAANDDAGWYVSSADDARLANDDGTAAYDVRVDDAGTDDGWSDANAVAANAATARHQGR